MKRMERLESDAPNLENAAAGTGDSDNDNSANDSRIPSLWLVATPIGNLEDMTLRAVRILQQAHYVLAEDTRRSRKLLTHFGVETSRLHRFDANATDAGVQRVLKWLRAGKTVALVTDAGMPSVNDPGAVLVRKAVAEGFNVSCAPGPSAITMAVTCSGLVDGPFYFSGFPPRQNADLHQFVHDVSRRREPCVLFESPHRVADTLRALADAMPERQVVVGRELTKAFEQFVRGTLTQVAHSSQTWMGEITIVLGPWDLDATSGPSEQDINRRIDELIRDGTHTRTIASIVAAWSGRDRRQVYARVIERTSHPRSDST